MRKETFSQPTSFFFSVDCLQRRRHYTMLCFAKSLLDNSSHNSSGGFLIFPDIKSSAFCLYIFSDFLYWLRNCRITGQFILSRTVSQTLIALLFLRMCTIIVSYRLLFLSYYMPRHGSKFSQINLLSCTIRPMAEAYYSDAIIPTSTCFNAVDNHYQLNLQLNFQKKQTRTKEVSLKHE